MHMIRVNGQGVHSQGVSRQEMSIKKREPYELSPAQGDTPNYTWLNTKHFQKLAKGINASGIDVIRAFINYPNVTERSALIHKWMLNRDFRPAHNVSGYSNGTALSSHGRVVDEEPKVWMDRQSYKWKDVNCAVKTSDR